MNEKINFQENFLAETALVTTETRTDCYLEHATIIFQFLYISTCKLCKRYIEASGFYENSGFWESQLRLLN